MKKGKWTQDEDDIISNYHKKFGNQWRKIAFYVKGRSANAVKNRWNLLNSKNKPDESTKTLPIKLNKNSLINIKYWPIDKDELMSTIQRELSEQWHNGKKVKQSNLNTNPDASIKPSDSTFFSKAAACIDITFNDTHNEPIVEDLTDCTDVDTSVDKNTDIDTNMKSKDDEEPDLMLSYYGHSVHEHLC